MYTFLQFVHFKSVLFCLEHMNDRLSTTILSRTPICLMFHLKIEVERTAVPIPGLFQNTLLLAYNTKHLIYTTCSSDDSLVAKNTCKKKRCSVSAQMPTWVRAYSPCYGMGPILKFIHWNKLLKDPSPFVPKEVLCTLMVVYK